MPSPPAENNQTNAGPAFGPKLHHAIDQALDHLARMAATNGYDRHGWPANPRLWKEILSCSKDGTTTKEMAPNLLKGDLASATGNRLGIRQWQSFERWFKRHVEPDLKSMSLKSGIPALRVTRVANRRGGYPNQSEAVYFLSFQQAATADTNAIDCQPVEISNQQASISSDTAASDRRWRFGLSFVLLSIFVLTSRSLLPAHFQQLFAGFSIVLFFAGLWEMDGGNNGTLRPWD